MTRVRLFLLLTGLCWSDVVSAQALPARFEHDRVLLEVQAGEGSPLHFYTDTGGGWNAVTLAASERLGMRRVGDETESFPGKVLPLMDAGRLAQQLPLPLGELDGWLAGRFVALASDEQLLGHDGFLGSRWFAGRRWLFDYPQGRLSLWPEGWQPGADWHSARMSFKKGPGEEPGLHFPRFTIEVDGQSLEMLLDTGAQVKLDEDSASLYGLPVGTEVASSFIVASIFERWRRQHPDWRVAKRGDSGIDESVPMIEVPEVRIAGVPVGPVWFAMRPDANFHDFMTQSVDVRVEGAVGGSAFRYMKVALDYPSGMAWFQRAAIDATEAQ